MNPLIKREVALHLIFTLCFLFGLLTADFLMGDPPMVRHTRKPANPASPDPATAAASSTETPNASDWLKEVRPVSFRTPASSTTKAPPGHVNASTKVDDTAPQGSALQPAAQLEEARIQTIRKVAPAVVCIFGLERQGGGSGVLIHPSGLALTNHHVVAACGFEGWGGLEDGQLYRWRLIGNDPGGDLALIQLTGQTAFPFVSLGDSDQVKVGDWTLVMGNPFTLAEDYTPTVTHGIVSGIHRYQPGMSDLLLVYGDCIQTDTSINPGNSGGPLFDMQGNLIGINGRASFDFTARGRVNVGLGYAISVNQCRKFLPELMATKLVQHGTLDAVFQDRDGKVVCAAIYEDSLVGQLGLQLGDQLLEFEGVPIESANQYTNIICTLPAGWNTQLKLRREDGSEYQVRSRLLGLPYPKTAKAAVDPKPQDPEKKQPDPEPPAPRPRNPNEKRAQGGGNLKLKAEIEKSKQQLADFLQHAPGVVQDADANQKMAQLLLERWITSLPEKVESDDATSWSITETLTRAEDDSQWNLKWLVSADRQKLQVTLEPADPQSVQDAALDKWRVGWRCDVPSGEIGTWEKATWTDGEWNWQPVTRQQACQDTLGLQLIAARQWVNRKPEDLRVDGVGKIDDQIAVRLRGGNAETPYYLWYRLDDWTQPANSPLLQSSEDIDGRYSLGATQYDQWQSTAVGAWPIQRTIIHGLFRETVAQIRWNQCLPAEADQEGSGDE